MLSILPSKSPFENRTFPLKCNNCGDVVQALFGGMSVCACRQTYVGGDVYNEYRPYPGNYTALPGNR